MNDVKIFNSPMFGELRTALSKNGEPLFCLSDVCKALGLSNPSITKERLIRDLSIIKVSKEVVAHGKKTGIFKDEEMYFISEPGFYRCIFRSNKKNAIAFQDWVFNEVLPSLRTTGAYVVTKEEDSEEDIIARGLIAAKAALARREERIKELECENNQSKQVIEVQGERIAKDAPKVEYYEQTLNSKDCMTSSQVALDLGITAHELHNKLCQANIIYKQSGQWNLHKPYKGWKLHDTNTYTFPSSNGGTHTKVYTVWTQRGRRFIIALFKNNFNVKLALAEINGNIAK
nr:MAG TPA: repressor domain protein [Caudoviricetes sp.]